MKKKINLYSNTYKEYKVIVHKIWVNYLWYFIFRKTNGFQIKNFKKILTSKEIKLQKVMEIKFIGKKEKILLLKLLKKKEKKEDKKKPKKLNKNLFLIFSKIYK